MNDLEKQVEAEQGVVSSKRYREALKERDRYLSHLTIACSILADVGLTERYEKALAGVSE